MQKLEACATRGVPTMLEITSFLSRYAAEPTVPGTARTDRGYSFMVSSFEKKMKMTWIQR